MHIADTKKGKLVWEIKITNTFYHVQHLILYLTPIMLFITGCTKTKSSAWWPASGCQVRQIRWKTEVGDTLTLPPHGTDGIWSLPNPPESQGNGQTIAKTSYFAGVGKSSIMGHVDQVAGHHNSSIVQEYIKFENGNVMLAGIKSADSSRLYTVFDPPLMLLPANIQELDSILTCETIPVYQNALTGMRNNGPRMYMAFEKLESGRVKYKNKLLDAVICKLEISQDQQVSFEDKKLTIPKTVVQSNQMLIARGVGTLLEWGIRNTPVKGNQTDRPSKQHDKSPRFDTKLEIILYEHTN